MDVKATEVKHTTRTLEGWSEWRERDKEGEREGGRERMVSLSVR